ncbi:M20/M25/M40 family metallo-hydrolase [Desulfobacter postgatei]|jgi:tripeptide aminopeptidase|uniref:M20/M25/M40 family metallo-hydrolase n=1 Tax=Desulfobacter postgatei TaxID=2293 RepID=UPI002A371B3F|nr:M20/M25/M40 family metallo-hydrolase [Desulfobacter postgatei]MDX9964254.1 M20/M25/M40 family metallo-hydrolase [Desulfobacter postgatei]
MIDEERLGQRFATLARIDSESRSEALIAKVLEKELTDLGATVVFDEAGAKVNGDCGNLVAAFKGNTDVDPVMLSGHMDTVVPGKGVKVIFEDGVFRSDGTTILGSDDKSALAVILEVMQVIKDNNLPCPPVEVVMTVCEEQGLLGAKNLDCSRLKSKFGYILDAVDTRGIVNRAPAANKISAKIYGRAAHAGSSPENGISAIYAASCAIAKLELGRIDQETTCNLGLISGGAATNIVPEYVEIHGEARSHDPAKLDKVTQGIVSTFKNTMAELQAGGDGLPRVEMIVKNDFPHTNIPEDHMVIRLAQKAAANLGTHLVCKTSGGAADANIFFGKGIAAGVIGTGMTDVHTLKESIALKDMVSCAELILEILQIHATGKAAV